MSEADAKAFVVKALGFAMARDASSGGCIRTVTIDESGVRRDFIPGSEVRGRVGGELLPCMSGFCMLCGDVYFMRATWCLCT